jgi:cytochrome c oxidase subunit II
VLGIRPGGVVGAIMGAALLVGSLILTACQMGTVPATTLAPKSDYGRVSHELFLSIFWWDVGIFLLVSLVLLFVIVRFRERDPEALPVQVRGNPRLELAWTVAPVLVLTLIAFPTVRAVFRTQTTPPRDALRVRVTGHQWWWEFEYPELGVRTATDLHLPVGRPVAIELHSPDVIHSFWIPQLGGKRDTPPGKVNRIVLTPTTPGIYPGQCAEFCGASHANMRLYAVVEAPADFDAWVARQKAPPAAPPDGSVAAAGFRAFTTGPCVGCHTVQGVSGGIVGPDLTHVGSRQTIAGGMLPNTTENVARWLGNPPGVKPGSIMPDLHLSPADVAALTAYLETLK